jgi:hypothetical protein
VHSLRRNPPLPRPTAQRIHRVVVVLQSNSQQWRKKLLAITSNPHSFQRRNHLSGCTKSIAGPQRSHVFRVIIGVDFLVSFARRYALAEQLFMRKIRMRERGTERALTSCPVRHAKGAPIPQVP